MSKIKEYLAEMQDCHDMADVCELAHNRTVAECNLKGINVDCAGLMDCTDGGHDHDDPEDVHYGAEAGIIFNKYYDEIIKYTGI